MGDNRTKKRKALSKLPCLLLIILLFQTYSVSSNDFMDIWEKTSETVNDILNMVLNPSISQTFGLSDQTLLMAKLTQEVLKNEDIRHTIRLT
jgi:hypothetical protein